MSVINDINPNMVLPNLNAAAKKEVLMELAAAVHAEIEDLDANEIYKVLREREGLGSTGIGDGIAIPHGKLKGLSAITICFGRSVRGVPYDSMDGKPAHLFFLLLAPENAAASYLSSLAELSRFLKNPHNRSRLMLAADKEELVAIFAEAS